MITDTNNVTFGLQLGRFFILSPLRVDLKEQPGGKWLALLEPEGLTNAEWGYGETPALALKDLETTIAEMVVFFREVAEESLGPGLLAYKQVLARYVSVNTTLVGGDE